MLPSAWGWRSSAYTPPVCRRRGTEGEPMKRNCTGQGARQGKRPCEKSKALLVFQASELQVNAEGEAEQQQPRWQGISHAAFLRIRSHTKLPALTMPACRAAATASAAPNRHITEPGPPV